MNRTLAEVLLRMLSAPACVVIVALAAVWRGA